MEADSQAALGGLEDNDLASGTMAIVDRVRPHIGTILLITLIMFAALAVWTLIRSQRAAQRVAAWDECLAALAAGDPARLEDVVARYGGSPAAQWAELVLADTALADGNLLLMNNAERGRRRLEEAVGRYTSVNTQRPEQLAAERAILGLARARESLGELGEARSGYEALVAEYPESPFRPLAEQRVAALARGSTEQWYKWFESRSAAAPADVPETPAEPAADEPAADEPAADEPAADEPAADEPAADEPAGASEPAAGQQPAEPPAG